MNRLLTTAAPAIAMLLHKGKMRIAHMMMAGMMGLLGLGIFLIGFGIAALAIWRALAPMMSGIGAGLLVAAACMLLSCVLFAIAMSLKSRA
ncbi:MAG: hypothetical protein ACOCXA_02535 [Planctomycetota bacterium]